ncbi:hypothetical protein PIB30_082958, partial [Stylosanthes scabra]|nr:hypothetical protein [Stylosanthes scabra]
MTPKRADLGDQSLERRGGGPARQLQRSSQYGPQEGEIVKYEEEDESIPDLRLNECIYRPWRKIEERKLADQEMEFGSKTEQGCT